MNEFEIGLRRVSDEEVVLIATEGDEKLGYLSYSTNNEIPGAYEIDQFMTENTHPWAALALVRKLAETLGPDIPITAIIANEPIIADLRRRGFIDEALQSGELELANAETLSMIPMVRSLRLGGIITRKITIISIPYDPDTPFTIELSGITRPAGNDDCTAFTDQ